MIEYEVKHANEKSITLYFVYEVNGARNWHINITPNGKYICPLCEHAYINEKAIAQHLIKPHKECPHCELSFVGLPSHMRSHNVSASENSLHKECERFVERLQKRGYSNYEIDRALGVAFGVAT